MKHSMVMKFLAIFLTACSLVAAAAGAAGIVAIEKAGLYIGSMDELQDHQYDTISESVARDYAQLYAVKKMSNLTYSMRTDRYDDPAERSDSAYWTVKLAQGDEILVAPGDLDGFTQVRSYRVTPLYPIVSTRSPNSLNKEEPAPETMAPTTTPESRGAVYADGGGYSAYNGI